MESTVIYPFDSYSLPYIRHSKLLVKNKIAGVVSPPGWGTTGKDVSIIDGGTNTGIIVHDNFENVISGCYTVLFANSEIQIDHKKYIYPKVDLAIHMGKNIINTIPFTYDIVKDIEKECLKNNVSFVNYKLPINEDKFKNVSIENEYIFDIKKPVILVLGLCEGLDKFEIQVALREDFLIKGYKVSQIGSREGCELLGFHSFPEFMYSKSISESNKVVLFNHFIKKIEETENPDVVLIGVPGGIMPFNKIITNKFGILAYEICQAVKPDATVLSSYLYDDYDRLERLIYSLKYKFGIEVSCINISNKQIDFNEPWHDFKIHFITLDSKYVQNKKQNLPQNIPTFNIINDEDKSLMSDFLISTLNKYACTEII